MATTGDASGHSSTFLGLKWVSVCSRKSADPSTHPLGTLFINTADATIVAFRFLASATVCRIILTYELHGLKEVVSVPKREQDTTLYEIDEPNDGANAEKAMPMVRMTM